jgi:hypothetical protein
MYLSLALRHRKTQAGKEAKQRLAQLAEEARDKLRQIDARLAGDDDFRPPVESLQAERPPRAEPSPQQWQNRVIEAFRQYSELIEQYENVPTVASELRRHVARQRRQPEYAAVLNEPKAKTLWELGQQHEKKGEPCCAYWMYDRSARLVPAPSALRARDRFAEMKRDAAVVAAAETCRCIRECHGAYLIAERLIALKPERAKERLAEIVQRAPEDSEVYRLAKARLAEL